MWTFRNLLAIGLFLFGSTFLWMTAAMAGKAVPPKGAAWTLANVLAFLAVIGFSVTAWAVFKQYPWWDTAALVSGVIGVVAVVPFVVGQRRLDVGLGDLGVQINLWMHLLGSAAVIAIAALPGARDWVTDHL
ncbi:hypothetical protein [Kocuria aegyptia]|uniref:DUF1761 domain-containing protein n=1 Tax=Kocuria aegyptia TaxID=330943 RepID=A0ABN2KB11_9MICC